MTTHWHQVSAQQVVESLEVDQSAGLSEAMVAERLEKDGPNSFTVAEPESILMMTLRQFRDVANIILLAAAGLSLALAIREGYGYIEPIVIAAIVAMNLVLAISQERGAERALEALQSLNSPSCFVLRDGHRVEIDTAGVVPGDILLLKTGDLVPADARLIDSTDLYVDESSLTGESEPCEKNAAAQVDEDATLGDMATMVFSGCLVTAGNATAVAVATGMHTQMGKTAGYLNDAQKLMTPLQRRLNRVGQTVSLVAVVSSVVYLAVGVHMGQEFWSMMLAAVALAVAAVPEMLQLIVTLSLTHGVRQMVNRHALVRKLPAVETLGNTSVICSDKTGTLTQNRMAIQRLWVPGAEPAAAEDLLTSDQRRLLRYLVLASNASVERTPDGGTRIVGDATESAILRLLTDIGDDRAALVERWPRVGEVAFSSARKMMTTVHQCPDGGYLVLTKGAFDRLPFAAAGDAEKVERKYVHDEFGYDALRVIALGSRHVDSLPDDLSSLESDLEFVGIIGLIDPPRQEAFDSIAIARRAGVRTVMITGDHAATAGAIARELDLMADGGTVVTGKQLAAMDDQTLIDNVREYSVYARVSPEDKIRIVEAWQANGEVVAMTGDGVNDAPALKSADVGVAMGIAGTEVAKSAADIVLTDDNFATIVAAIREGRTVFGNIRKAVDFLLVCNFSEIAIMMFAQFVGWGKPLTPVMLLLINVLGDGIPGLYLAKEAGDERMMQRAPIGRKESVFTGILGGMIQQAIVFSIVGLIGFYFGAYANFGGLEPSLQAGQTMAFLIIAFTSIVRIFTVRTKGSIFKRTIRDNWGLANSAFAMIAIFTLMALIPPFGAIFGIVAISAKHWLLVIGLTVIPTIVAEIDKIWQRFRESQDNKTRLVCHAEPAAA